MSISIGILFFALMRYCFQTDNRTFQRCNKKYPPYSGRFLENQYARQYGSYRTYSCPYSISRTNRQGLRCLYQQKHADTHCNYETCDPLVHFTAGCVFNLAHTGGKRYFEQSCHNQIYPTQNFNFLCAKFMNLNSATL